MVHRAGDVRLRAWPAHHPRRVGLGLALEPVGRVGHPQPRPVVRTGDGSLALLDDMGQLVGEGVSVPSSVTDDDVIARGVGTGAHLRGGRLRGSVRVNADSGEVRAEPGLHVGALGAAETPPAGAQDVVDGRAALHGGVRTALHGCVGGRRGLLLVAAPVAVLMVQRRGMPGPAEHLDDGGVPGRALQGHASGERLCSRLLRSAGLHPRAPVVVVAGVVLCAHEEASLPAEGERPFLDTRQTAPAPGSPGQGRRARGAVSGAAGTAASPPAPGCGRGPARAARRGPQWLRGKPRSTPAGASAGSGQRVVVTLPRV